MAKLVNRFLFSIALLLATFSVQAQNSVYFNGSARADILKPYYYAKDVKCIEAWVKPDHISGRMVIWSYNQIRYEEQWHGGIDSWMERFLEMGLDNGAPYILVNNDHLHKSSTKVKANEWIHVAFNYNKDTAQIYLNGKLVYDKRNMNEGVSGSYYNERSVAFGAVAHSTYEPWDEREHYWNWKDYYKGYMKDVRVWKSPRTQREIFENRYNVQSPNDDLLSEYLMDVVNSSGTIYDNCYTGENRANSVSRQALYNINSSASYATSATYRNIAWWTHIDGSSYKILNYLSPPPYPVYGYNQININKQSFSGNGIRAVTSKNGGIITDDYEGFWAAKRNNLTAYKLPSGYNKISSNNWDFIVETTDNYTGFINLYFDVSDLKQQDLLNGDNSLQLLFANRNNVSFEPVVTEGLSLVNEDTLQVRVHGSQLQTGIYAFGSIKNTVPGNAIKFDGIDNYISGNSLPLTNNFTIEFWAKPNEAVQQPLFTHDSISPNTGIYLEIDGQREELNVHVRDKVVSYKNPFFSTNTWGHYALSYNDNARRFTLYVNGYQAKTFAVANSYKASRPFYLGMRKKTGFNTYFKGEMDEFRVWNTVRSENEIRAEMPHALADGSTGLIRYHRMDLPTNRDNRVPSEQLPDRAGSFVPAKIYRAITLPSTATLISTKESFISGGKAMEFNGLNQLLTAPNIQAYNNTQEFCIEAWVKPTYSNSNYYGSILTQLINTNAARFQLALIDGKPTFFYQDAAGNQLAQVQGKQLENDNWHHIAVNYKNKELFLLVDGVPVDTLAANKRISEGTGQLLIGGDSRASGRQFKGEIDEVRIWNKTQAIDSIILRKNGPLTGMELGLVALFNFDAIQKEKSASHTTLEVIEDISGSRNRATTLVPIELVEASWGASRDVNLLLKGQQTRVAKNGLRINTEGFFESNQQNVIAFGHYDQENQVAVREIGETKQYALTRSWYITKYDDKNDYTKNINLYFVPSEMGVDITEYLEQIPTVFYRNNPNADLQEVGFNSLEVTDTNVVVVDIPSDVLNSGYYTLGFKSSSQGSALAFTKGTSPLEALNQEDFIRNLAQVPMTYEFWFSPPNQPNKNVNFLSFSTSENLPNKPKKGGLVAITQLKNTNQVRLFIKEHETGKVDTSCVVNVAPGEWQHLRIDLPRATDSTTMYINGIKANRVLTGIDYNDILEAEDNFIFRLGDSLNTDTLKIDELRVWETSRYGVFNRGRDYELWTQLFNPINSEVSQYYDFNDVSQLVNVNLGLNHAGYKSGGRVALDRDLFLAGSGTFPKQVPANWPLLLNEVSWDYSNNIYTNSTGGLRISYNDFSRVARWSYSNSASAYSNEGLKAPISNRLGRTWRVSFQERAFAKFEFDPKEIGIDSFYPSNNYQLLYRPKSTGNFKVVDTTYNTYIDHNGKLVLSAELFRHHFSSASGYFTLGWSNDNHQTALANSSVLCDNYFPEKDTFTIEAWVNRLNSSTGSNLFNMNGLDFSINNSSKLDIWQSNLESSTKIDANVWYHVAVTYKYTQSAKILKLYIDGKLEDSTTVIERPAGGFDFKNGAIDELRFWNVERSPTQLQQHAKTRFSGIEPGLLAYYTFNQSGTRIIPNVGKDERFYLFNSLQSQVGLIDNSALFNSISPTGKQSFANDSVTVAGLTIANHGKLPPITYWFGTWPNPNNRQFVRDTGDDVELSYLAGANGLSNNNLPSHYASFIQNMTRRWYVNLSDPNQNGGYLKWKFNFNNLGITHTANKDHSYYLLYSPTKDGQWQVLTTLSNYLTKTENAVVFITEGSKLPNGYYSLGIGQKGWIQALEFDGANDYVSLGKLPDVKWQDNEPFTLEAWVKPNGSGTIFSKTSGGTNGLMFGFNQAGYLRGQLGGTNNVLIASEAYKPNAYNHVAMVYDGDSLKLMVNGKYAGGRSVGQINNAQNFYAYQGASSQSGRRTEFFAGFIDEFRIWNKALEPYELRNYALGNVMHDSGLVYRFTYNLSQEGQMGNQHKAKAILNIKNINQNQWQPSSNPVYIFDTRETRKSFTSNTRTITASNLSVASGRTGNHAFLKNDKDNIYLGHLGDSLIWTANNTASNIDARFKNEWLVNINDDQLDGGQITFTFNALNEWNGPLDSNDYFLLYRQRNASTYRLVRYSHYTKDLSSKKVVFETDVTKLRSGFYTLGYAKLGELFVASDTTSDAEIKINYQVPAYCLQNNGAKPVVIQIENGKKQVVFERSLDSFSINTAFVDSFTHYVDAGTKDLFRMNIYNVGPGTKLCAGMFSDSGATKGFVQPQIFVDSIYLHKNRIYWADSSDQGNAYRLTRISSKGDTVVTMLDSTTKSYVDSIGGPLNLVNGEQYQYCLQVQSKSLNKFFAPSCISSKTVTVNFQASNNAFDDRVEIKWNNISAHSPKIALLRDGSLFAVLKNDDSTYTDLNPVHGKKHVYGLSVYQGQQVVMQIIDTGWVEANGSLTGNVRTLSGEYAVPNCTVTAKARIDDSVYTYTTKTNFIGQYKFSKIYFGTGVTFEIGISKQGHEFVTSTKDVRLSAADLHLKDINFQSINVYDQGNSYFGKFTSNTKAQNNHNFLSWAYDTKMPTLIQVFRNDSLLDIVQDTNQYIDATVEPNTKYNYRINAYVFNADSVTEKSNQNTIISGSLAPLNAQKVKVLANNDLATVNLSWDYPHKYVDGIAIYRNNQWLADVEGTNAYTDESGINEREYTYHLAVYKTIQGKRNVSAKISAKATYPALNKPSGLKLKSNASAGDVRGNFQYSVPNAYNFKGLLIYRTDGTDTSLVTTINKGKTPFFNDTSGIYGKQYTYLIQAYKYKDSAMSEMLSGSIEYPALPAPSITEFGYHEGSYWIYKLKWAANTKHYTGTVVTFNGATYTFPKGQTEQVFTIIPPTTNTYLPIGVGTYTNKNGSIQYSQVAYNAVWAFGYPAGTLPDIEKFTASSNNAGFVRLNWGYPKYVKPTFVIWRDGIVIKTLPYDSRSFNDENATPGKLHSYLISAFYNSNNSQWATAYGKSTSSYVVNGEVRNKYTGNGVPNVRIEIEGGSTNNGFAKSTTTDQTGFYQLEVPKVNNLKVKVTATKQNYMFSPGSITMYDTANTYQYYFTDTTKQPKQNSSNIAQITQFLASANESRQNAVLRFNVSGINYTGLEIKRGPRVLATIRKGEALNYTDTSGIAGYTYLYSARLYWDIQGSRRYSNRVAQSVDYPAVAPVEDLVATAYDSLSTVKLEWSHPNELVNHYAVYRDGSQIAKVQVGQFGYSDTNGIPGNLHRYEVAAVNISSGRSVASAMRSVNKKFPHLPRAFNLSATALPDTNSLQLQWIYPVARTRGYLIMRNNEIIDTVKHSKNQDTFTYVDAYGNPGTANEYGISPYTYISGKFTKATPITLRTIYPALKRPSNFVATPRNGADLVRMNWEYPTYNITGFVVFRDGIELARIPKSQNYYDDQTGLPKMTYNYSVVAYSIRRGKQFVSKAADASVEFPEVSSPRRLWASQFTSMVHVLINWEHNGWLQVFDEERGYELEYAPWALTSNLQADEDSMPDFTSTWLTLDDQLNSISRYYPHLNPVLQEDIIQNSDMAANHYRICSYRRINGKKYYSRWIYASDEGLTRESKEANYQPKNVTATQGTKSGMVTLTWEDQIADASNFISYNIYRKGFATTSFELLGSVAANREVYHDNEGADGTRYIYEIRPKLKGQNTTDQYERGVAVLGWSQASGTLKGSVKTKESSSPVAGATITASNKIGKELYVYTAITNNKGEYQINNVYAPTPNDYDIEVSFLDHEFEERLQQVSFTKPANTVSVSPFIDLNSFEIKGRITQLNTDCGIDSIKVKLTSTYNDGSKNTQEATTDEDGAYSIIFNPYESNLVKLEVEADTFKVFRTRPSQDTVIQYFDNNYLEISDPKSLSTTTEFNLVESTSIRLSVQLQTTCGPIPGENRFAINVQSTNGCYNEVFETDAQGALNLHLPPKEYRLTVIGVSPLNQTNYPYIEYFTTVNKTIDLTGLSVDDSVNTTYTYHTIPSISYTGLNDYCGNNVNEAAIVNTEGRYALQFGVKEKQFGVCSVSEGYLLVYNDAVRGNQVDTLTLDANGDFETYFFQPDNPNPTEPYSRALRIEYHAPDIGFLNERLIPLIVEGISRIPGNDIMVNPSENGDVQLPLYVLRDPPGDGSYSYIEKGTSFTQNVTFEKSTAWEVGGYANLLTAGGGGGIHFAIDAGYNKETTNGYSYDINSTFSQNIQTAESSDMFNKDLSNYLMGEEADVIVGAGLVSKYGITWNIEVQDQKTCKVNRKSIVATGPGQIKTTWVYTVDHIKGLVAEYDDKIAQIRLGILEVEGEDTATSIAKFRDYRNNWNQVLSYHEYETKPHVCLCDKVNYYRLPKPWQNYLSEEGDPYEVYLDNVPAEYRENVVRLVTESFCDQIGAYSTSDNSFILNEDFEWTQDIISDYNTINTMLSDWKSHQKQFLKVVEDFDYANGFSDVGWSAEYNWRFAPEAKNITFSGGTRLEESYQVAKSRFKTKMVASTTNVNLALGFSLRSGGEVAGGNTVPSPDVEIDLGVRAGFYWNYSDAETTGEGEEVNIGYVLSDDDPGDQYSVTVVKGVHPNHSPYFALLGGRSSCPVEPGTISRDQYDFQLLTRDDKLVSPTQRFLDPDEPAIFSLKITNNSPFLEARDLMLAQNENTNRKGAQLYAAGHRVANDGVYFYLEADQSEYVDLIVYRAPGSYAHEDLEPSLNPLCDGYFDLKDLQLKAYWQHPCTDVDIISENNFAIYSNPGGKEQYFTILGGYDVDNELLQRVNLKYRRLGDEKWTTWAIIPRDSLVAYYDKTKTNPPRPPRYPIYWDITGNKSIIDGTYELVAEYICDQAGTMRSNVVQGTVDRSSFRLIGTPSPSDAILSLGETVKATYNKHIAEHKLMQNHYQVSYVSQGQSHELSIPAQVLKNELFFQFSDSLRQALDGQQISISIDSLWDVNGRFHYQPESWNFIISNNPLYWNPAVLKLSAYSGSKTAANAQLQYAQTESAKSYSISFAKGTWFNSAQTTGLAALNGENIAFTVDARSLSPGLYRDTVRAQIADFGNIYLPVELHVARKKPNWHVNPAQYEQSVHVMANYTFGSNQLSTDTMDIIAAFVGHELRGVSRIIKNGSRYVAYVPVHGNASDKGRKVHFRVWKASNGNMYDAWLSNNDTIKFNPSVPLHGSLVNPRILNINTGRDLIRKVPLHKGWNWLSLNVKQQKLEQALLSLKVEDGDVIKTLNSNSEFTDKFGNGGQWISTNGLNNIAPENGYLLHISNADTLLISGDTATNYKLNVNNGWNLIGYPKQKAQPLDYASFNPVPGNNDILKSHAEVAVYGQGAWNGTLTEMQPYKAYMLRMGQKGTVAFKKTPRPENWEVDPSAFEFNMTVTARLLFDGDPSIDTNDIVGAFVDGDLRGLGKVQWLPSIRKYRVVLFVYSNEIADEYITFQLYDSDRELLYNAHETIEFEADKRLGKLSEPYLLSDVPTTGVKVATWIDKQMSIYPNPTKQAFTLQFESEMVTQYQITITDMLGRVVYAQKLNALKGRNAVQLDADELEMKDGLYHVILSSENFKSSIKLIKD